MNKKSPVPRESKGRGIFYFPYYKAVYKKIFYQNL